jgi:hypothetical protein
MTEVLTKQIMNCETGEITIEPLTEEEIADRERMAIESAERWAKFQAEIEAKAEAKASALAKLTALGLTEEEANAIASA